MELNRAAFLALNDGKIQAIDLYYPEPLPNARREHNQIVPPPL